MQERRQTVPLQRKRKKRPKEIKVGKTGERSNKMEKKCGRYTEIRSGKENKNEYFQVLTCKKENLGV